MAQLKITDGPGKFDLMCALFDSKQVKFTLDGGIVVDVFVYLVEQEDGSNESWNLNGSISFGRADLRGRFKAYFSTRRREGLLTYI
jgi:hypothetical protein